MSERMESPLQTRFLEEERAGLTLGLRLRVGALAVLAVWVLARVPGMAAAYFLAIGAALALTGFAQLRVARGGGWRRGVASGLLILLDMAVLTVAFVVPNPLVPEGWPIAMQLRLGNFNIFFLFVAFAVLSYSPAQALWTGMAAAFAWSVGVLWILEQGDSFTYKGTALLQDLSLESFIETLLDPNFVSREIWLQQVILILLVAAVLAAAVLRSRRLVQQQVRLASERAKLTRYFSPNIAERLARSGEGLAQVGAQSAAILFVDIVGFTKLSARLTPEGTIALLRAYHGRMARAVFAQDGTLNKYLGDGLMASFGTPEQGPHDASSALACAHGMLREIAEWNEERRRGNEPEIEVGIGLHWGTVVLGDVGDERCLEFAVLGETVNLASRLEASTRTLGTSLAVSHALVERARREGPNAEQWITPLRQVPPRQLPGLEQPVSLWVLPRAAG